MSWKDEFDEKTLRVGKRYFEKGCVDGFVDLGDSISAFVDTGNEKFYVSIDDPGKPDNGMRCTCYYAFNGFECYHMAAVMYYWERHCKTTQVGKNAFVTFCLREIRKKNRISIFLIWQTDTVSKTRIT